MMMMQPKMRDSRNVVELGHSLAMKRSETSPAFLVEYHGVYQLVERLASRLMVAYPLWHSPRLHLRIFHITHRHLLDISLVKSFSFHIDDSLRYTPGTDASTDSPLSPIQLVGQSTGPDPASYGHWYSDRVVAEEVPRMRKGLLQEW